MKIGVIADTHIPAQANDLPKAIFESLKDVDMIIHAGDLVDLSVLDKLSSICNKVIAVWGNMDSYEVRKVLPEKEVVNIGKHKIGIMHGHGHPDRLLDIIREAFKGEDVDLVIFGHSHRAINEKKGNIVYFNPGSPTDKIFANYNSYGIIEINDKIEARIIKI